MSDNLARRYSSPEPRDTASMGRSGGTPPADRPTRVRRIRVVGAMVVLFLCLFGAAQVVDYFADMPRERAQRKFNYAERVWYGLKMWSEMVSLRLAAAPDPFPNTKLPVIDLSISSEALRALSADLPRSGRQPYDATLLFGGSTLPVQARYTGISINHWGMPWKSWNFKVKEGGGSVQGLTTLNAMMPRSDSQFENWLGNEMSRRMGAVITPFSEFVHFRINGAFNGFRLLLEPVSPQMIRRLGLPPGKLFGGDITTEQIYDGVPRERLFSKAEAWDVQSPFPENQGRDEIAALIRIVQTVHNPYDFFYQLPSVANVDAFTRYMALLEIVSSVHIDETHNWKMYWNSQTKQLEPIIWNSVAYYWKNTKSMDLAPNDLFRVILSNPELREDKDRAIWRAIQGPLSEDSLRTLIRAERERIAPDVYASALKWGAGDRGIDLLSNQEWDAAVEDLFRVIGERHSLLRNELEKSELTYRLGVVDSRRAVLAMKVGSRSGVKLEEVKLQLAGARPGTAISISRWGLDDLARPQAPGAVDRARRSVRATVDKTGIVSISVGDTLTSKRRAPRKAPVLIVPATYVYQIELPPGVSVKDIVEVKGRNSVTGGVARIQADANLEIPQTHTPNIVWWSPREFLSH